jgi:hypothetical protein
MSFISSTKKSASIDLTVLFFEEDVFLVAVEVAAFPLALLVVFSINENLMID